MKPKKQKDFVTKKRRVGKEQFRKHASSDAKLLADVSRLKKTVKLATQSIIINKERLNVTSRNLTLAELVRKSRHISSSVQIHALSGIVEFCRKFDADVRLNLLTLLQIAGECLNSLNQNVRQHARTLLMELVQHFKMGSELLDNNTYVQCVSAYLLKGIVASDIGVRTDIYRTVTTLVDQFPGIISLHKENILDKLVRHKPDEPAVAHIDCILALYKLDNESLKGHSVVNYLYEVLNHMLFIAGDIDSELKCLSIASLIVKTLKLLCINAEYITRDDLGFIRAFVLSNLHQFEDLTERGMQTFDALNCDYVLYRAELGLKCARVFPKHQLALMAPLCQLYNMRNAFCESHAHRVADIVLTAMAADMDTFLIQDISDLKPQWCTSMLVTFNSVDTLFTGIRKALQTNSVTVSQRILMDPDSYMAEQLPVINIRETFRDVTRGLVDSIADKPEVLPVIAIASGVSPMVLQEFYHTVPGMSQVVDIMSKLGPDFCIVDNMDIDTVSILSLLLNMDKTMSLRSQVLFTVVQVSKIPNTVPVDTFMDRYCTAKCIATLNREDLCLVTRALLNFPASKDIGSRIMDLLKQWLCNVRLWERCYTTELIAPTVYHMFCEGPECVIGIDDRLVPLNSLLEVLCEIAVDLDKMLTADVLDILEYVLGSFVSRTIEHLIRSQSNNIWSVEDAREVVFKRCVSTAIEKMIHSGAYNMGVCVLNTALIHAVSQCSNIQVDSQEIAQQNHAKLPQWLHKLEQHNTTEALINRLPMDKNLQNPIKQLCLAAGQLLM